MRERLVVGVAVVTLIASTGANEAYATARTCSAAKYRATGIIVWLVFATTSAMGMHFALGGTR